MLDNNEGKGFPMRIFSENVKLVRITMRSTTHNTANRWLNTFFMLLKCRKKINGVDSHHFCILKKVILILRSIYRHKEYPWKIHWRTISLTCEGGWWWQECFPRCQWYKSTLSRLQTQSISTRKTHCCPSLLLANHIETEWWLEIDPG